MSSSINRFRRRSPITHRKLAGVHEHEYLDVFDFETNNVLQRAIWKTILMLPYNSVWHHTVIILSCIVVILVLLGRLDDFEEIDIVTDIMLLIDVLLVMCGRISGDKDISLMSGKRTNWIIIADLLSLPPEISRSLMEKSTSITIYSVDLMSILECLKAGRIFYHYHYNLSLVGNDRNLLILQQFFIRKITACLVTYAVLLNLNCPNADCPDKVLLFFYQATSITSIMGFANIIGDTTWLHYSCFLLPVSFFVLFTCTLAYYMLYLIDITKNKFIFTSKMNNAVKELNRSHVSKRTKNDCINYFNSFWKQLNTVYNHEAIANILPKCMLKEFSYDMHFSALKHSKLLRDVAVPILKDLAEVMTQEFLLEGHSVYDKNKMKNKMVYLERGVVQILAEEDEETPLISFSDGTCLGEASLIIPYKSKAIVRCKTFCRIHVLHQQDFIKVVMNYPDVLKSMRETIYARIQLAKEYKIVSTKIKRLRKLREQQEDNYTLMWIKTTLHKLMMLDEEMSTKHQHQNIFLRDDTHDYVFDKMLFLPNNLDLFAITERVQLQTDSLFLKFTFPYIFKPRSLFILAWQRVIYVLSILTGLLVPYYAFVQSVTPNWFIGYIYLMTIIWWIDIYVEVSTAVDNELGLFTTFQSILLYKTTTTYFCIDLISAIPCEMFACMVFDKITSQRVCFLYINRIFKMYDLVLIYNEMANKVNANLLMLTYLRYLGCFSYLVYFSACVLYSRNCYDFVCIKRYYHSPFEQLHHYIFSAVSMYTGLGIPDVHDNQEYYYFAYITILLLALSFAIIIFGNMAAMYSLQNINRLILRDLLSDSFELTKIRKMDKLYTRRISNYVHTQWTHNMGMKIMFSNSLLSDLPEHMFKAAREDAFLSRLQESVIFKDLPEQLISDICALAVVVILPPGEIICYSGEITKEFYYILKGHCALISHKTCQRETILGPKDLIAAPEVFMNVPFANTVITLTHCKMLSFDYVRLCALFNNYKKISEVFKKTAEDKKLAVSLKIMSKNVVCDVTEMIKDHKVISSFNKIGYNLDLDSQEEYDYYIPFDRLGRYSFIRLLLLKVTFNPEGKFMMIWESVRFVCALLSSVVFVIPFTISCKDCYWYFLHLFLDLMAAADIYVRFHVCFYNKRQLLVTHPLETAKHYLKHGFLLDFLSMVPINYTFSVKSAYEVRIRIFMQANRIVQIYRCFGFCKYLFQESFAQSHLVNLSNYILVLILLANTIGCYILNTECDFHEMRRSTHDKYGSGVRCSKNSIFGTILIHKPLTPIKLYLVTFYMMTSYLTLSGMQGFVISNYRSTIISIFLAVLGFLSTIYVLSAMITGYLVFNNTFIYYREGLDSLKTFMKVHKVKVPIQKETIQYFELKWKRKQKSAAQSLDNLYRSITGDVVFELYKDVINYCVFADLSGKFYRMLFVQVGHDFVASEGYVTRVNDINKNIHILYNGTVDVLAADGSLLACLGKGSLFGNLNDCEMSRQTVSIKANGHVELLTITSTDFHKIIKNFPMLLETFQRSTLFHTDFIPGNVIKEDDEEKEKNMKHFQECCRGKVYNPLSLKMRIWNMFVLIFVCYISTITYLYQLSTVSIDIYFVVFQYIGDIIYVVYIYFIYHTAYEDEYGILIKDMYLIRKKANRNRFVSVSRFIAALPLDVFVWIIPFLEIWRIHIFLFLRLNRFLRIIDIMIYYKETENKLSSRTYVISVIYLASCICLVIHVHVAVMVFICCICGEKFNGMHDCYDIRPSNTFNIYISALFVVISGLIKSSQTQFYPQTNGALVYSIFIMMIYEVTLLFFIAKICSVIIQSLSAQSNYVETIEQFKFFMQKEKVSKHLFERIWRYIRYYWIRRKMYTVPTLLLDAPLELREKIFNASFGRHINSHYIFESCHSDFRRQIIAKLNSVMYFAGDYVVYKGAIDDTMYFIHVGEIVSISEKTKRVHTKLGPGQSFGVMQCIYPQTQHQFTFLASEFTVLLTLNRKDLMQLLNFYPASKSTIMQATQNYVGF